MLVERFRQQFFQVLCQHYLCLNFLQVFTTSFIPQARQSLGARLLYVLLLILAFLGKASCLTLLQLPYLAFLSLGKTTLLGVASFVITVLFLCLVEILRYFGVIILCLGINFLYFSIIQLICSTKNANLTWFYQPISTIFVPMVTIVVDCSI